MNFLQQINLDFKLTSMPKEGELIFDTAPGEFQRWGSHRQRYRFKGHTFIYNRKTYRIGTFIDLLTGGKKTYYSWKKDSLDVDEYKNLTVKTKKILEKEIKEFDEIFNNLDDVAKDHPYILKKKINIYGDVKMNTEKEICVPSKSLDEGNIIGIHRIFPNGGKGSYKGSTIGYFDMGKLTEKIYICEGYATACTIHGLTKCKTIVTFGQIGMVKGVSKAVLHFSKKYPRNQIIVCLDNVKESQLEKYKAKTQDEYLNTISKRYFKNLNVYLIRPEVDVQEDEHFISDFNDLFIHNPNRADKQLNDIADLTYIIPLGYKGKTSYLYSSSNREIHTVEKGDNYSTLMFIAPESYWSLKFPYVKEKDLVKEINAICSEKKFNRKIIRGAGIYRDDGNIVVNDGKNIFGKKSDQYIYLPMGSYPTPDKYELNESYWRRLREDFFPHLNLKNKYDIMVILAYGTLINIAPIIPFRFNMDFSGQRGIGKNWIYENIIQPFTESFGLFRVVTSEDTVATIKESFQEGKCGFGLDENEADGNFDSRWLYDLSRQSSAKEVYTTKFKGGSIEYYPVRTMILSLFNAEKYRIKADIARLIRISFVKNLRAQVNFKNIEDMVNHEEIKKLSLAMTFKVINNFSIFKEKYVKYLSVLEGRMNYHQARVWSQILCVIDMNNLISMNDFEIIKNDILDETEIIVDRELESDIIIESLSRFRIYTTNNRENFSLSVFLNKISREAVSSFDHDSLEHILERLEREYGLKITIKGTEGNKVGFLSLQKNCVPFRNHLKREGLIRYCDGFSSVLQNEGYSESRLKMAGTRKFCTNIPLEKFIERSGALQIINLISMNNSKNSQEDEKEEITIQEKEIWS